MKKHPEWLPHWACVAFVARCANQVLPIFDATWPDAPEPIRGSLVRAIRAAADSAASAKLVKGTSEIEIAVTETVGRLVLSHHPNVPRGFVTGSPADAALAKLAADSANVAAKATETARAEPGHSHGIAMEGFSWALAAAADNQELIDTMNKDLDALRAVASHEGWTHKTAVVWDGSGWNTGKPKGGPWWKFW